MLETRVNVSFTDVIFGIISDMYSDRPFTVLDDSEGKGSVGHVFLHSSF